jgi:hypothetical protein
VWVYNIGRIGQFGSLTYILASFEIVSKGTFYMWDCVKTYTFQTGPLWKPWLPENFSQGKLCFFSFYICFIRLKVAVLFVNWNKPNSANQLLNFAFNSYPLVWFHCVPFSLQSKDTNSNEHCLILNWLQRKRVIFGAKFPSKVLGMHVPSLFQCLRVLLHLLHVFYRIFH